MIGKPLSGPRRDGVILVVVVSLLALFAVVGLGYVIYAESAATASRLQRESQVVVDDKGHLEPELVLNRALAALIYDHADDQTGVYSALRGHSLARSMYGQRDVIHNLTHPITRQTVSVNTNTVPFNGIGRLRYQDFSGLPSEHILNFMHFRNDSIIRDPEKYPLVPTDSRSYRPAATVNNPSAAPTQWFGGYNAPYTYPDHNNVFLAAVRANDGQVLIPSFHRPYLFLNPTGATDPTFLVNTTHPDWYKPSGRLKLMRPRPVDQVNLNDPRQRQIWQGSGNPPFPPQENITAAQLTQYSNATTALINAGFILPYPTDAGGDVKNLLGGAGGNDSVWLDIGLPVRVTKSGKKFKPLVAFLVTDLDGRINLNVHGNLRGQPGGTLAGVHMHASNQGIGRHEINPMHVLTIAPGEHQNLFQGFGGVPGRYTNAVAPVYPRPLVTIGGQQVDLSQYAASFLNPPSLFPPNATDVITTSFFQIGAGPVVQDRAQLSRTITFPNPQYDPPYMRIDFDGANEVLSRVRSDAPYARNFNPALLQQQPLLLSSFPDYHTSFAGTPGAGYGNESAFPVVLPVDPTSEQFQSAFLFNPLRNTGNSRLLDALETHNMIARYNSPLHVGDSLLSKLLPQNLSANSPISAAIRHRITLVSADVGRTGWMPQTFQRAAGTPSAWGITNPLTIPFAQQGELFPQLSMMPAPGSPTISGPNDFAGNPLFVFAAGQQPATQPPGGSVVPIRQTPPNTNVMASYDGRAGIANMHFDGGPGQPITPRSGARLDLNRPLPPYPTLNINPAAGMSYAGSAAVVMNQIQTAERARQEFAKEIFERLMISVGAPALNPPPMPGQPDHQALQYLAQLAVNIVDDIDEDDVATVFAWNPGNPQDLVFGVEMPKVVANEVYIEKTNGDGGNQYVQQPPPIPPGQQPRALKYQVNVWLELHHTMVPPYVNTNNPGDKYFQFRDRQAVWLNNQVANPLNNMNPTPVSTYRILLVANGQPIPTVSLNNAPPPASPDLNGTQKITTFNSATRRAIYPVDTKVAGPGPSPHPCSYRCEQGVNDAGFYVVGPDLQNVQSPGTQMLGNQDATFKTNTMSYDIALETGAATTEPPPPQIVLQRLVNPYLPEQSDYNAYLTALSNGQPAFFNPYITVDAMKFNPSPTAPVPPPTASEFNGVTNTRIMYNRDGPANPPASGPKYSVMRRQPFAGAPEHLVISQMIQPGPDNVTMFRHNGRSDDAAMLAQLPEANNGLERFDWYIHHDRKLVSPMELIHVAAVAPWDLTQTFIRNDPVNPGQKIRQGHTAPWFDHFERYSIANPSVPYSGEKVPLMPGMAGNLPTASARLYRALEQFRVGDRTVEMAFGGRDLGKININTIWDQEVFNALCDAWVDPNNPAALDHRRGFTQGDVDYAWSALTDQTVNLTARTPMWAAPGTYMQITGRDRPFLSAGAPHMEASQQYPPQPTGVANPASIPTEGIETTLFRSFIPPDPTSSPFRRKMLLDCESQFNFAAMNQPAVQHPLMEKALLSKIYEHVTTRSNVFAVYMTVGYFEVTDDTQKPELLGDEIGIVRDRNDGSIVENKAIRHRMFAIVDRTNLTLQPPTLVGNTLVNEDVQKQGPAPFYYSSPIRLTPGSALGAGAGGTPAMWEIQLPITSVQGANAVTGSYNGMSWQVRINDVLYVGSGAEQRRLVVRRIQVVAEPAANGSGNILTALIGLAAPPLTGNNWPNMDEPPPHPELVTNAIAGHPGPQPDFDHKMPNYRGVVLYSVIME